MSISTLKTITIKPRFFSQKLIQLVEERKNAKFVFESSVKQSYGWLNQPVAIFYTEEKHPVSNSNYMGIVYQENRPFIIDGQSAVDDAFTVMEYNGEYFNSVFRHDYVCFDGNGIDGGRDYMRIIGEPTLLKAKIINGEVHVIND